MTPVTTKIVQKAWNTAIRHCFLDITVDRLQVRELKNIEDTRLKNKGKRG